MTTATEPVSFPFGEADRLELDKAYAAIRESTGMIKVRLPFGEPVWLVTRYADAKLVFGDRRFSRAMAVERDAPRWSPIKMTSGILAMDPPEHNRLRLLVAKAFNLRNIEAMRPRIRELAEGFLDDMIARGAPADLVEQYALSITVAVICEVLGVPVADRPKFRRWTDAAVSTSKRTMAEAETNQREMYAYMYELIARRRAEPADDLMTALIAARDEQDRLSEHELAGICVTLLVAGHETTATQIPNFVYVLLEHPDKWDALRANPDLLPAAVEEMLRFVPMIEGGALPRYATEDVQVGDVLVRAGEALLVNVAAANRDGERFGAPDELRFDREENQHIGFGHGVHHCLGAQLARVELQEALHALLIRMPELRLAGDVVWKTEMMVRGPRVMPVAW